MQVVLVGTAGSGKTSLTFALAEMLRKKYGFNVKIVNLDPGAENVQYKPDYDVRRIISVRDLMVRENLGPNGAMLKAMEIIQSKFGEIELNLTQIQEDSDIVLYDTPGQMEVFVFHPSGPFILDRIKKLGKTVGVFLIDPWLANSPSGLATALLLSIVVRLRMSIPIVIVISKSDLADKNFISEVISNPESLLENIKLENVGTLEDLASELVKLISKVPWIQRPVFTSVKMEESIEELYLLVHEAFCTCGDLT